MFLCVVCVLPVGSSLLPAYREYLEHMFECSDDLVEVDQFTVPLDLDPESPSILEWCDIG